MHTEKQWIELYCYEIDGKDVWHDGRFLDKWAGESIVHDLEKCFAHYDKQDIWNAFVATNKLFEKVTREIAVRRGYIYPDKAAICAKNYLEDKTHEKYSN